MNANKFKMPFGKYKGRTLDAIAESVGGLSYLNWLHGERLFMAKRPIDVAIDEFFKKPGIMKELAADQKACRGD